eukprot:2879542-Amphidinium_carterae.1
MWAAAEGPLHQFMRDRVHTNKHVQDVSCTFKRACRLSFDVRPLVDSAWLGKQGQLLEATT